MICLCIVAFTKSGHLDTLNKTRLHKTNILSTAYFQIFHDQNCKSLGTINKRG